MTSPTPHASPSTPDATAERRQHARIAFHTPAQLELAGVLHAVVLLDISLKGALIRLPAAAELPLDAGALCRLHVALNETGGQIDMDARVAHADRGLAGLLCQLIDIDSATHLRRLVELNLGDPSLLERELSALIAD